MMIRRMAVLGRIVPAGCLAMGMALAPIGCGAGGPDTTPRVLEDPPPPDPDEMSSDNMPDPKYIQSLNENQPGSP